MILGKKSCNNDKGRQEGGTHFFCQKMLSKVYPDTLEARIKQEEEVLIFVNAHRKGSTSSRISVSISPGRYFQSIVFVYPQEESVR
jgi:hypothetical protein